MFLDTLSTDKGVAKLKNIVYNTFGRDHRLID